MNVDSRKVLCNLTEFFIREKKSKAEVGINLLGMGLKVAPEKQDVEFGRLIYILGHLFGEQKMYVRGEGLFANARDVLEKTNKYEKVEMRFLFGNMLRQIEIRKKEGEEMIERGKKEASEMPEWHPYLVNFFVPEMEFN